MSKLPFPKRPPIALRLRLIIWIALMALLPMIGLTAWAHWQWRQAYEHEGPKSLLAVAQNKAQRMDRYAKGRIDGVETLALMPDLVDSIEQLSKTAHVHGIDSPQYEELVGTWGKGRFSVYLNQYADKYDYPNVYLISPDGMIVYSVNRQADLGANLSQGEYANTVLGGVFRAAIKSGKPEISDYYPYPTANDKPAMFVAARVHSGERSGNRVIGVVALQFDNHDIYRFVGANEAGRVDPKSEEFRGLGETGEIVLASQRDDEIVFLTPTRHDTNAAFNRRIKRGEPMMPRLQDTVFNQTAHEDWKTTTDYRNRQAVSIGKYIPLLRIGMVVKVDEDEIYAQWKRTTQKVFYVAIASVVVVLLLAFFIARRIYAPIARLTEAVSSISKSEDLKQSVPVESDDEIGELSRSFNAMGERLRESYATIEDKVFERTRELREKNSLVRMLQRIAVAANEADSVEEALRTALREVCDRAGMQIGHVYELSQDGSGELVPTGIWYLKDPERFPNFRRVTEETHMKSGEGLPGLVLKTGKPEWVPDNQANGNVPLPRARDGAEQEVRGGFAFPVLVGREVAAVLEFHSDQPVAADPSLLQMMTNVGAQLGRVVERKRAEEVLSKASAAAEAASEAKSSFLANMSHELRTPLNAILGYSELLQEMAKEENLPVFVSDLQKINVAGHHLLTLINSVLDLSRIEAGKMPLFLETFDVQQVVGEVAVTVEPLFAERGNRFEVSCPPDAGTMRADVTKVRQILFNLLGNARKFTERGLVRLEVERRAEGEGGEWIVFSVRDTGIGMTEEQMRRIFQDFAQAEDSTSRRFGGTGLGLSIAQKFCKMMGGDIAVESEPGRGTTFTVRLPAGSYEFGREPQPAAADATVPAPPEGATVVLVVDDDPAVRELMKHFLGKEGFRVEAAPGGEEGIALARALRPDVITLDVMMPGTDGWAVLSRLKADPDLEDIPVIMLTIVDDKKLGYTLGAAEYMTKPIDWARLTAVLKRYRHEAQTACTVLVVEDDDPTRVMLRRSLERDGWGVEEAENGRVALARVAERPPDLILLDLMMPEMDGFEFLAELRGDPRWTAIPVAIITAKDITSVDRDRLSGYVQKILEKGNYNREELLREVRHLVAACARRRRAQQPTGSL